MNWRYRNTIEDRNLNATNSSFAQSCLFEYLDVCKWHRTGFPLFIFITVLFSRELLTPQQHYDWGLRALKTVVKGCGNLLQAKKKGQGNNMMFYLDDSNLWINTYYSSSDGDNIGDILGQFLLFCTSQSGPGLGKTGKIAGLDRN